MTFALAQGEASLVSAVSGTYPLVTVGMASVVLKERITWYQCSRPASSSQASSWLHYSARWYSGCWRTRWQISAKALSTLTPALAEVGT